MAEQPASAVPSAQKSSTYGRGIWISYKVDTWSRLRSSLHSVARFLRIMSPPSNEPMEEFNGLKEEIGFDHVEGFYTSFLNLYKSAATCMIDRNRWKVTRISTFKSNGKFEHESLVAEVVCGQVIVYLRMERKLHISGVGKMFSSKNPFKAKPKTQTSDDSDPPSDNATYPRDTTRPTPVRSTSKIASDELTYSKAFSNIVSYDKEEWVDVIRFTEGKELSLPQIAVLARCVNNMGKAYNLIGENCYWFAYVMVETAKLIGTDFTEETISKRKRGEWKNLLNTMKPTPEMIGKAKDLYDENWEAFNKDIYDTINNKNSEIYREERRKREEAERLEKEERQKREEAERLAAEKAQGEKEERQKREEAERLEKEERRKREEAEAVIKRLEAQLAAAQTANSANNSSS